MAENTAKAPIKRAELSAKFLRPYRKAGTGMEVAVYTVTGTPTALLAFKEAQGENYKTDNETGLPLYFVAMIKGRRVTPTMKLVQTVQFDPAAPTVPIPGRFVVDNSATIFADSNKFADLVMGEEAKLIAQRNILGFSTLQQAPQQQAPASEEEIVIEEEIIQ